MTATAAAHRDDGGRSAITTPGGSPVAVDTTGNVAAIVAPTSRQYTASARRLHEPSRPPLMVRG